LPIPVDSMAASLANRYATPALVDQGFHDLHYLEERGCFSERRLQQALQSAEMMEQREQTQDQVLDDLVNKMQFGHYTIAPYPAEAVEIDWLDSSDGLDYSPAQTTAYSVGSQRPTMVDEGQVRQHTEQSQGCRAHHHEKAAPDELHGTGLPYEIVPALSWGHTESCPPKSIISRRSTPLLLEDKKLYIGDQSLAVDIDEPKILWGSLRDRESAWLYGT